MSKGKKQDVIDRRKTFTVASITTALIMLNVIPFTYNRTLICTTYGSKNMYQREVKQEVSRMGIPFAYWWQNSEGCDSGLAMDANSTHTSGVALFWNLSIIGLISVGLSFLINPTTKRIVS